MRPIKATAVSQFLLALGLMLFGSLAAAQDQPRRCYGTWAWQRDSRWSEEAASLRVIGGAPAYGYPGCVAGYPPYILTGPGIYRTLPPVLPGAGGTRYNWSEVSAEPGSGGYSATRSPSRVRLPFASGL